MKISILTENCAGSGFMAEHGLSYLIEHEGERVLFDAGSTDVFLKNANLMGVDIQKEIDTVVLSHGHWDHGDGLRYINNKKLITHPGAFIKRYRKKDNSYLGLKLNEQEFQQKFNLVLSKEPYYISDNIIFLGEIPRVTDFESKTTNFIVASDAPDFVLDDSAIVVVQNNELIVVTACSHAGICNIIEYAIKVTGINCVKSVIGGFHLKENNFQTKETIKFIKNKGIQKVYPSHCTDFPALVAFFEEFQSVQLKTGMVLNF